MNDSGDRVTDAVCAGCCNRARHLREGTTRCNVPC